MEKKSKQIEKDLILKIVKEISKGTSYSQLSKKYKISQGTLITWVKRYNDKGYINRSKKRCEKSS